MLEKLLAGWAGVSPRERRLVLFAGAVLLLAAVFLVFIEPAWRGRAALQQELPLLRAQLATVQSLAQEAGTLAGRGGAAPASAAQVRLALEKSAAAAGLGPSLQKIELNGELIEMRFRGVSHERWLGWLAAALPETRTRVVDLSLTREATPGVVSARVVLEAPRRRAG
ncbi:MAG: type II secretion system protein M [Burkholderiales bacterium]|jgi:general secretion pathway protein M